MRNETTYHVTILSTDAVAIAKNGADLDSLIIEGLRNGIPAQDFKIDVRPNPVPLCANGHSSGWHMGLRCTRCGDVD